MLDATLKLFNPWWKGEYTPPGIIRGKYLKELERMLRIQKIAILYGLRRVGKTFIMKQFISRLIPEYGPDRIYYASIDHPQVRGLSIIDLLGEFRKLNRVGRGEKQVLFLDEVHHREGFEWELKALHDTEEKLLIVIAGSSSLVVRHKSSALTGRYMKMEIRPLDFREYLEFIGKEYDSFEPDLMEGLMEDYLVSGGMPQYVLTREPQVLLNIVEDVIYKDIVKEYGVRDVNKLNELFYLLMDRVGRPLSYSRIGRLIGVGKDAAARYIDLFRRTYLLELCEKHGTPNERIYSPRKVYCPDNGIRVVMTGTRGIGSLAENLVFNILKEQGKEEGERGVVRYHHKDRSEVDFISRNMAVEVKYRNSVGREDCKNLLGFRKRGIKKRIIVTRKETEVPGGLESIPLWKLAGEGLQV
ncbi:MAG: ATP-binding protein [Thermoplasmata archaeon]|nr:ATP-binding protein [Thermoplasmata archaeon]